LKNPVRAVSLPLITLVLAAMLSLDGCTAVAIVYYYRHKDDATRWACSHDETSDRCTLKVEDGEIEVSGLKELTHAGGDASQDDAAPKQYGLKVHFIADKVPLAAELLKTHLLLPDDSVLTPIAVVETDEVADMGRQPIAADPQLVPPQQQRTFELQFPVNGLPDAYMISLAPLQGSDKQHGPPVLAMRIEYGPN